jgi:hypothetical protein
VDDWENWQYCHWRFGWADSGNQQVKKLKKLEKKKPSTWDTGEMIINSPGSKTDHPRNDCAKSIKNYLDKKISTTIYTAMDPRPFTLWTD